MNMIYNSEKNGMNINKGDKNKQETYLKIMFNAYKNTYQSMVSITANIMNALESDAKKHLAEIGGESGVLNNMPDIDKYINGTNVNKDLVIEDIVNGTMTKDQLNTLLSSDIVKSNYYGNMNDNDKLEQKYWNQKYVDKLKKFSVFQPDYLLYLFTVSEYIRQYPKLSNMKTESCIINIV